MEQAKRLCGLCRRSPREDDAMGRPVRLKAEDLAGARPHLSKGVPADAEPGLYQLCEDCLEALVPVVDARLGTEQIEDPRWPGSGVLRPLVLPGQEISHHHRM